MQKRTSRFVYSLALCLAALATVPGNAQAAPASKPPIYLYSADWAVPRAQWGDMVKLDEQDRSILDKLVADGTLLGYGAYTNLIHQEGGPTHGSWFSAASEGNLLKALETIYAQPGLTTDPVQAASKHWDQIFVSEIYSSKPGTATGGYLTWSRWVIKPGAMRGYTEFVKKVFVPVLDKLLADGTITSYGELTEYYHQDKPGVVWDYFTAPDTAALDKANRALEQVFDNDPTFGAALRSLAEVEGHRDYLTRIRFMVSK